MAVYEGTRYYPLARPAALPRRRYAARVRAGPAAGPASPWPPSWWRLLIGLFYLTQTVRVAATTYDIDTLAAQREQPDAADPVPAG